MLIPIILIPFLFYVSTLDPVSVPQFLALSVATSVLIFIMSFQIRYDTDSAVLYRAVFPIFFCYLLASAISLTKAVNLTEGIFEWLKLFLNMAFFYAASQILGRHKNEFLILTRAVIISGMMHSVIALCQYYDIAFTFIPGNFNICGTMANKNLLASAVFLMTPFALYGILQFSGAWRGMSLAAALLFFAVIIISKTRAVWAAILIAVIITRLFAAYNKISLGFSELRKIKIIVLTGVILISAAAWTGSSPNPLFSRDSLKERVMLWEKTLRMIQADPIVGVGLGQWKIVLPCYGKIEKQVPVKNSEIFGEVWFQRPHNDYLWVLSETGIFGFLSYLSFFLILFFYLIRIAAESSHTAHRRFSVSMLFGLAGYMVIAFFCFPKERTAHNIFLMLIAASIVSAYHRLFPIQKHVSRSVRFILHSILLILLTVCIVFGYERLIAEIHTRKALAARKGHQWETVISEIDKANSGFYTMDPASTPLLWYRGIADFSLGRTEEALEDFKKACQIHPYHIHVLNNLGTCHALSGDYKTAAKYYEKAIAISPGFKEAADNLKAVSRK